MPFHGHKSASGTKSTDGIMSLSGPTGKIPTAPAHTTHRGMVLRVAKPKVMDEQHSLEEVTKEVTGGPTLGKARKVEAAIKGAAEAKAQRAACDMSR